MKARDLNAGHIGSEVTLYQDGMFLKGMLTDLHGYVDTIATRSIGDAEEINTITATFVGIELNFGNIVVDPIDPNITVEVEEGVEFFDAD